MTYKGYRITGWFFSFLLLHTWVLYAQSSFDSDTLFSRLYTQIRLFPQEKIYLQTDKPAYVAGEKIWFRAFVVNALSLEPEFGSRYVYTELVDPFDSVIYRVKVRPDAGSVFSGCLKLSQALPEGTYTLRAYTRYMENQGEAVFFRKPLRVMSPLSRSVHLTSAFRAGENGKITGYFEFKHPAKDTVISLRSISFQTARKTLDYKVSEQGVRVRFGSGTLPLALLVKGGNYACYVPVTPAVPDYAVSFLPEGGYLLAGVSCRIAFKALNEQGYSEEVTGTVRDEEGTEILSFSTFHRGMGYFDFIPEAGKTYYAFCRNGAGRIKKVPLPLVQTGFYGLKANALREHLYVAVNRSADITMPDSSLVVFLHQEGLPVYAGRWDFGQPYRCFDKGSFMPGPVHIVLLNGSGQVLSERVAFIKKNPEAVASVTSDSTRYGRREKIRLHISVTDSLGMPLAAGGALSVTDKRDVEVDSCSTIFTSLLLSANLKGYVEDAGWYFRRSTKETAQALDLLMLTQGWNRYDIPSVLRGEYVHPAVPPEQSMQLCGTVTSYYRRKALAGAPVRIWSPDVRMLQETVTDRSGRFCLQHFEFPDSTRYMATATDKTGKGTPVLELDSDRFPGVTVPLPFIPASRRVALSYVEKADRQLTAEEGIRTVLLDEVLVTAPKKKETKTAYQTVLGAKMLDEEEIKQAGASDFSLMVASHFPGFLATNGVLRYQGKAPLLKMDNVLIDDVAQCDKMTQTLRVEDIEQIDVIKNAQIITWVPIIPPGFADCLIAITLKQGKVNPVEPQPNRAAVNLLGYQKPVEFYSPQYAAAAQKNSEQPDLRTTLYWNPRIRTDADGTATVEFYSADTPTTYSVVLEGITPEGKLFRTVKEVEVN
ncbi:MAG: hypothetical protein LIP00_02970 [Parabacteroides sp.]|nr:hypothetical protein [Parabacteroides sp.]